MTPPLPGDAEEVARRKEAAKRRRLLEGAWRQDAVAKIRQFFPATTAERLGHVDQTRNLLRSISRELAVRYQTAPTSLHPDAGVNEAASAKLAGLWPVLARNERYVVGLNTSFVLPTWGSPGSTRW
jgi:hypothetical protein